MQTLGPDLLGQVLQYLQPPPVAVRLYGAPASAQEAELGHMLEGVWRGPRVLFRPTQRMAAGLYELMVALRRRLGDPVALRLELRPPGGADVLVLDLARHATPRDWAQRLLFQTPGGDVLLFQPTTWITQCEERILAQWLQKFALTSPWEARYVTAEGPPLETFIAATQPTEASSWQVRGHGLLASAPRGQIALLRADRALALHGQTRRKVSVGYLATAGTGAALS